MKTSKASQSTGQAKKAYRWILLLGLLALVLGFLALSWGRYPLHIRRVYRAFGLGRAAEQADPLAYNLVFQIRLPRILMALLAGAGLAAAGAAFQALFANPLASPNILGVAGGASFGAVFALLLGLSARGVQVLSVLFAALAIALVYLITAGAGRRSTLTLLLAGLVVSALFQALISLVKYLADPMDELPAVTFWLMGGLGGVSWDQLRVSLPFLLAGLVLLVLLRWQANLLSLPAEEARSLGVNLPRTRFLVILAASMITGSVVSACGQIGWLGLLIPHIARLAFGQDNRFVIPASLSLGALFFLLIDSLARGLFPAEIPASILLALVGAPLFIIFLRRKGGPHGL